MQALQNYALYRWRDFCIITYGIVSFKKVQKKKEKKKRNSLLNPPRCMQVPANVHSKISGEDWVWQTLPYPGKGRGYDWDCIRFGSDAPASVSINRGMDVSHSIKYRASTLNYLPFHSSPPAPIRPLGMPPKRRPGRPRKNSLAESASASAPEVSTTRLVIRSQRERAGDSPPARPTWISLSRCFAVAGDVISCSTAHTLLLLCFRRCRFFPLRYSSFYILDVESEILPFRYSTAPKIPNQPLGFFNRPLFVLHIQSMVVSSYI